MKLHLGCGPTCSPGWINVDYALGARLAPLPFWRTLNRRLRIFDVDWSDQIVLHDLTKPFPWPDESADAVYSSHTLEHLSKQDGLNFLKESYRVLKPGGSLRIVVPDLRCYIDDYLTGTVAAEDFVDSLGVLTPRRGGVLRDLALFMIAFPHKCMYDTPALIRILKAIGLEAEARQPFDSNIPGIRDVELEHRVGKSVIVEGQKRPAPRAAADPAAAAAAA